jgi:uncharacterized RDD family membrane protein YckC
MKNVTAIFLASLLLLGWVQTCPAQLGSDDSVLVLKKVDGKETATAEESQEPGENAKSEETEEPLQTETRRTPNEIISYGKDVHLKSGETADTIVVLGGSAKVEGTVSDTVVAIGGSIEVSGSAREVVAVFGSVKLLPGAKTRECVAVLGGVRVESGAETREAVAIGGGVNDSGGGKILGEKISLGLPGFDAPEWAQAWFQECFLKLRPLAPTVGWVWIIAGLILLLYLLVLLVFRGAVEACANEVIERPATTLLVGLLTKIVAPLFILLLLMTGVGIIVVPFILLGLFVLGILGKVSLLVAIGSAVGRNLRIELLQNPFVAFLLGAVVLVLLYMIPILGLIIFTLVSVWGIGAGVTAAGRRLRRERPPRAPQPRGPQWPAAPVSAFSANSGPAAQQAADASFAAPSSNEPSSSAYAVPPESAAHDPASAESVSGQEPTPPRISEQPLRYAGFWERMGAALLDIVLVSIVASLPGGGKWWYVVALAYFSGMWAWRGTTIGGTVLGLKVARADGQPVLFPVALLRSVTAAFSALVLFLGFFWIGWDAHKQGWHDKVAGTVVVKMPRAVPLLCF